MTRTKIFTVKVAKGRLGKSKYDTYNGTEGVVELNLDSFSWDLAILTIRVSKQILLISWYSTISTHK